MKLENIKRPAYDADYLYTRDNMVFFEVPGKQTFDIPEILESGDRRFKVSARTQVKLEYNPPEFEDCSFIIMGMNEETLDSQGQLFLIACQENEDGDFEIVYDRIFYIKPIQ
jgi:hypothetical protein